LVVNARARQLLGRCEDPSAGLEHLAKVYGLHRSDGALYPVEKLPVCLALRQGLATMCDDIVVHRPDGRRIPLVAWAAPIDLRGQGQTQAAVWVLEDLTVLRQAERARRESDARLRAVIETMAEGLVVQDTAGTIRESNPAAAAILEVSAEALQGHSLLDPPWRYFREDETPLPAEEHPAQVARRTGTPVRNVVLGIQRVQPGESPPSFTGGNAPSPIRWTLVNALPLPTGPGEASGGVVTTFTDITAHRQAQETMRASEEKYRGLVETLPLMVIQFDREARATYINPATQAITGYALEDFAGNAWQSLVHPDDLPSLLGLFPQVVCGQTVRTQFRYRARDGREQEGYLVAQPRGQDGRVVGFNALIVDMTRERRLERELQCALRLELVGRLASGIAHDFNNLLTVILAMAELAQARLAGDHPARDELRRLTEAGQQAAGLASQLLAFSKQRRTVTRRVDVNRIAFRTLEMLRPTLPPHITMDQTLANEKLDVEADEVQLHQVVMNLCLNARDAMPHGGQLLVRTEAVPSHNGCGAGKGAGWVRLSVRDEGLGMSDAIKARIFDPFFSTKEHGTGLGLAVVQQIVHGHGGAVQVWSQPDKGSCFEVWLPREPCGAPACVGVGTA
jgi:PAS domain S-box-containing protein